MRALCISTRPCFYRHNTGYCGYVGNGCALDDTSTAKVANTPTYRITQPVDISPESIEKIADAVVAKLRKEEVKHGHWIDKGDFEQCSACKATYFKKYSSFSGKVMWIRTAYCPNCGAKMDEVTE